VSLSMGAMYASMSGTPVASPERVAIPLRPYPFLPCTLNVRQVPAGLVTLIRFAMVNRRIRRFKTTFSLGKSADMPPEDRTGMVAQAIDMNLDPARQAAVLACVWNKVVLVGEMMTSAERIAAATGAGGSSPGRVRASIVIVLQSMRSRQAASMIVRAIAGSVAESVTMSTCSLGFTPAQVRSKFTAPRNALGSILNHLGGSPSSIVNSVFTR